MWTLEKQSSACINIRMDAPTRNFEAFFLLSSDRHHDSVHNCTDLELEHLQEAVSRQAGILDFGDLFDGMQGRDDPRRDPALDLKAKFANEDYFDAIINDAVEFYEPFSENIILLGQGNHETAVRKKNGVNLTSNLAIRINERNNSNIFSGGYSGWVRFLFKRHGSRQEIRLKWHHGYGGGGGSTKGTSQSMKYAVQNPDAHIIATGHTHDHWILPIARERLKSNGQVSIDEQLHIRCGTYKNEWGDGTEGWAVEKNISPKPLGAVWLRFFMRNRQIQYEAIRAV